MSAANIEGFYKAAADPASAINKHYATHVEDNGRKSGNPAQASTGSFSNPYWQASMANSAKEQQALAASGYASNPFYNPANFHLPYPDAPHDGSPQDLANTKYTTQNLENANKVDYFNSNKPGWLDQLALMLNVGAVTAGLGSALAPAVAGLAPAGSTLSGALGGATTGAIGGTVQGALTGQNIGKAALTGAALGGLGGAAKPFIANATGLSGPAGTIVNNGIQGAATGAVRGALSGNGAGAGALSGGLSSAGSAAGGAVAGSIFNSGNTVDPQLSQQANPNMSVDPSQFGSGYFDPTNGGLYGPDLSGNTNVTDPSGGYVGGIDYTNPMSGFDTPNSPTGGYLPTDSGGNVLSQVGGAAGGSLGSLLSKLLGSGSGSTNSSALGSIASLLGGGQGLQSLLSTLASGGASYLNSDAAKGAAGNFANQTSFNPYNVSGPGGSTSFNGNTATSTLSPEQQQLQKMLSGLSGSSGAALAAGPQDAINSNFNALQSADLQAQQRLLGNSQDNQFANGILSSTAGGYQTQGALQAIGAQTGQNYNQAVNQANTQQQQQLAQLTAGLNGNNQINASQLAQLQAGLTGGAQRSYANDSAYSPSLAANSNTPIDKLLGTLGNSGSTQPVKG